MSEGDPAPARAAEPRRQRADSLVAVTVARFGAASGLRRVAESGSARVRWPRGDGPDPLGVLINTGGGIATGDRLRVSALVEAGAALVMTTAAAEKIYGAALRPDHHPVPEPEAPATIETALRVEAGGRLDWVPQETILFDRARLHRRITAELAPDARLLLFEATVFGRAARGEQVETGAFRDRWAIRRGGRLVYAEALRLEGRIAEHLRRPAVAAGLRATATCLLVAPDAEAGLEAARDALEGASAECGASAWDGMLLARFLAPDVATLRRDAARFMQALRGRPLPRVWHL